MQIYGWMMLGFMAFVLVMNGVRDRPLPAAKSHGVEFMATIIKAVIWMPLIGHAIGWW